MRLVIRSTPESIRERIPSFIAIVEIFASIGGFFLLVAWKGWAFPTLLISFTAPALLLRSGLSVKRGLSMLNVITKNSPGDILRTSIAVVSGTSLLVATLYFLYSLNILTFSPYLFAILISIIAFAIFFGLSLSGQVHRIEIAIEASYAAIGISLAFIFIYFLMYVISRSPNVLMGGVDALLHLVACVMLSSYIFTKFKKIQNMSAKVVRSPLLYSDPSNSSEDRQVTAIDAISLIAGTFLRAATAIVLVLFAAYRSQRQAIQDFIAFLLLVVLIYFSTYALALSLISALSSVATLLFGSALVGMCAMLGVAVGAISLGLFLRAFASLCHPIAGFRLLADNWIETNLLTDVFHTPELMPKASRVSKEYSISGLLETSGNLPAGFQKGAAYLLIFSMYLSSILYRFLIKGTCWIWWPLALSASRRLHKLRRHPSRLRVGISFSLLGVSAMFTRASLAFLLVAAAYQVLVHSTVLLGLVPKDMTDQLSALASAGILPTSGIRLLFFVLTVSALTVYWGIAHNASVSFENPLKSPKEFSELAVTDRNLLFLWASRAERFRLVSLASTVCFLELQLLYMFAGSHPDVARRYLGYWFISIL